MFRYEKTRQAIINTNEIKTAPFREKNNILVQKDNWNTCSFHGAMMDRLTRSLSSVKSTGAKNTPTLLETSTRAMESGAAINSLNVLVKKGVEADLYVWDALPHAF